MKRIIITVKNEDQVEIIHQVLCCAADEDDNCDFPFTFDVEDVDDIVHPYFEDGQ